MEPYSPPEMSTLETNNNSTYPSGHTSTTAETSMRLIGHVPPSRPAPSFPISLLPKDENDFILRLSKWEIDQIVAPIHRGVLLGDSVFLVRDLSSNVELTIVASKFLDILKQNDLYTPNSSIYDSIRLSSAGSVTSVDISGVIIPLAPKFPAPKCKSDLINGLMEHEVRELLAPVKSEVLSQDSIFSLSDALTGRQFAVAAVELMDLFPDEKENGYDFGYETINVDEDSVVESGQRRRKYLICILSAVALVALLSLAIGLVFLLGATNKVSSSAPGDVTSPSSTTMHNGITGGNTNSSHTTNTTEKSTAENSEPTPSPGTTSTKAAVIPSTTTRKPTTPTPTPGTTMTTTKGTTAPLPTTSRAIPSSISSFAPPDMDKYCDPLTVFGDVIFVIDMACTGTYNDASCIGFDNPSLSVLYIKNFLKYFSKNLPVSGGNLQLAIVTYADTGLDSTKLFTSEADFNDYVDNKLPTSNKGEHNIYQGLERVLMGLKNNFYNIMNSTVIMVPSGIAIPKPGHPSPDAKSVADEIKFYGRRTIIAGVVPVQTNAVKYQLQRLVSWDEDGWPRLYQAGSYYNLKADDTHATVFRAVCFVQF